jgi:hypothetical protein
MKFLSRNRVHFPEAVYQSSGRGPEVENTKNQTLKPCPFPESVVARRRQTRVSVPCPVSLNAELVSAVATPLGPTVNLTIAG